MTKELKFDQLTKICDPEMLGCESTADLTPLQQIIGQERAVRALKFGLEIKERGFNIFASGRPGTGRMTALKDFLEYTAKSQPVPSDWCYVNNFRNPYEPKALKLPSGRGREYVDDIKEFIEEVKKALPNAFTSEDYAKKREARIKAVENKRDELLVKLNKKAQEEGFVIQRSPIGLVLIPVKDGKPMSDKEILELSPKARKAIKEKRSDLEAELRNTIRQLRDMEKNIKFELQDVNKEVTLSAIGHLVNELEEKYKDLPDVQSYLKEVEEDILDNVELFITKPKVSPQMPIPTSWLEEARFKRYQVNIAIDNSKLEGAPVIVQINPTYQNLFGKIEKEAQFGALTTDFTMIRCGSLHHANGGYLVLPAVELVTNPLSYQSLKRALRNERINIEEAKESLGVLSTKSLKPQSIPLSVKVALVGTPDVYRQLYTLDPDFKELFKVKADFDTTMERNKKNMKKYAAFVCTLCKKEKLKHVDPAGVAKLIEYSSRMAADQTKLTTMFHSVADIVREASFYATKDNTEFVGEDHVKKAIEEKLYRSKLIEEKIQEMIDRGILLFDVDGEATGQINGLSVLIMGDFTFGRPSRVTVSIGLGRRGVIDIEREANLGGPTHTKGVQILSGYLYEKFAQDKPLSLTARLTFEQSYSGVDGDSASSTELYAILSELSGAPIKQQYAVTGSVNQKGEVQAIGGVNFKIEGFFEVCKSKGLTGKQGVLIPESNVENLVLKDEVIQAVKAGKFHIYPVKTIDEGIEILTGVKAGKRKPDGSFEEGTIYYKVNQRLKELADKMKEYPQFPA